MKNKRFKKVLNMVIGSVCGGFLGWFIGLTILGKIGMLYGILASAGWLVATLLNIFNIYLTYRAEMEVIQEKIKVINDGNDILSRVLETYKDAGGSKEDMPENISIYSKLANYSFKLCMETVTQFLKEIKPTDTMFLVRIDHDKGVWYLKAAGRQIHVVQAQAVMVLVKDKIREMARDNGIVVKRTYVAN